MMILLSITFFLSGFSIGVSYCTILQLRANKRNVQKIMANSDYGRSAYPKLDSK